MQNKKIFGIIVGAYPILNIYATGVIPGISIGQLLLLFFCASAFFHKRMKGYFLPFIIYGIIITIICWFKSWVNIAESLYELLAFVLFFFFLNNSLTNADYKTVKQTVSKIGLVSCVFFYIQYALMLVGIRISGLIPGLPMSNGGNSMEMAASQIERDRLSSIFQEPAHYAEFMAICLVMIMFTMPNGKKKYFHISAIALSILLCQSAGGYFLLLAAFVCWLLYMVRDSKGSVKAVVIGSLLICVPALVYLFSSNELFMSVLARFQTISFTPEASEHGYSSYTRLLRGYIPIVEGDALDVIFGKGIGTLLSYVRSFPNSDFLTITDYDPNWINSFQFIILYTGSIGGFLFFKQLFSFYKQGVVESRTLVIIYILALFSSGILLTGSSLLFIYLIYHGRDDKFCKDYGYYSRI